MKTGREGERGRNERRGKKGKKEQYCFESCAKAYCQLSPSSCEPVWPSCTALGRKADGRRFESASGGTWFKQFLVNERIPAYNNTIFWGIIKQVNLYETFKMTSTIMMWWVG